MIKIAARLDGLGSVPDIRDYERDRYVATSPFAGVVINRQGKKCG